jgi:hypothetical protein
MEFAMFCFKCREEIGKETGKVVGLHEDCFLQWFGLEKPEKFQDLAAQTAGNSNQPFEQINTSFFQGKFKKYSAMLGGKYYILKVQEQRYLELPATEYLCNQLARHLGLLVPDFSLIQFEEMYQTFVCQNFMSLQNSSNLVHIYHFIPENGLYDCETLLRIIEDKTQRMTEALRFVELCLFDALIGNHDRHGRNLALIETSKGFQLSPFYDNPSYLGIEDEWLLSAQHEPRGKIQTLASSEPKMKEYVIEWKRLGFLDTCLKFAKKISLEEIQKLIQQSFISAKRKKAMQTLIGNRYEELIREIE